MQRFVRVALIALLFAACSQSHVVIAPPPQAATAAAPSVAPSPVRPTGEAGVTSLCQDKSGEKLPGVTVTLKDAAGQVQTCFTDAAGLCSFPNFTPGRITIQWSLEGFGMFVRNVTAKPGRNADLVGILNPAVTEVITVVAEAPLLDVRSAGCAVLSVNGGATAKAQLEKIPTSRDPWTILQRAPSVSVIERNSASYSPLIESGFKAAAEEPTTTFSIDVDKASYANVRRFLSDNEAPPPDAVRIEEMVNYFSYHYPQPEDGRPFSITSEVAGCPWDRSHRLLRIGIQAKNPEAWNLPPNNLVFLLDVSGSMSPVERLPLIKSALRLLVEQLRGEDSVAIVVYAGAAGLVLPPTSGADKQTILAALDNLEAGGSTNGAEGIKLAYQVAKEKFLIQGNNRVILATDGDFNVGASSDEDLTKLIEEQRSNHIYLTCLGVGDDNLKDSTMELLADKGNGNYFYLDSMAEAKKVFQRDLAGTLVTVADDVKVQLTFDPSVVTSYRQIGYEDRALSNKDFTDDTKDAGELGSGHSVTALYELTPARVMGTVATLRVRYKDPGATKSQEVDKAIRDDGRSFYEATPDTQFAAAVAEFGMLLRGSQHRGSASWDDLTSLARTLRGEDLAGDREELLRLLDTSRTLLSDKQVARK